MPENNWSDEKEETLRALIKERLSLSVADKSHDIKFAQNLIEGHEAEDFVEYVLAKGEVKRDYGVGKTGNIFIEHLSRGKPSGIATTASDYFIYVLDGEGYDAEVFVGIKTTRLQRLLDNIKWTVNGGDNKTSKGKLLRLTKLVSKI